MSVGRDFSYKIFSILILINSRTIVAFAASQGLHLCVVLAGSHPSTITGGLQVVGLVVLSGLGFLQSFSTAGWAASHGSGFDGSRPATRSAYVKAVSLFSLAASAVAFQPWAPSRYSVGD